MAAVSVNLKLSPSEHRLLRDAVDLAIAAYNSQYKGEALALTQVQKREAYRKARGLADLREQL
jgi:hypothetical protein